VKIEGGGIVLGQFNIKSLYCIKVSWFVYNLISHFSSFLNFSGKPEKEVDTHLSKLSGIHNEKVF